MTRHHLPRSTRSLRIQLALMLGIALAVTARPRAAVAAEFFVDPVAGSPTNDGSFAAPWSTLERVIADHRFGTTIHAGDTVWLRAGYHGDAVISGGTYSPAITLAGVAGATAHLRRVSFEATHGWVLAGVAISPSFAPTYSNVTMVSVNSQSSDVEVRDCRVFSVDDATRWTAAQWINMASNGAEIGGDRVTLRRCEVRNVRFGISVSGAHALIDSNQVINFSGDGMRGLGNYDVFQYNVVKNVYVSDADGDMNHDDGFQSWSDGPTGPGSGEVVGVVLRGNLILNNEDPHQPFQNSIQGIGCFDGFYTDWIVENNVIIVDHWHGISFYGMRRGHIVNNTVIDRNTVTPGPPWILVTAHKDGRPSENVVVRNNLSTALNVSGTAVVNDHNTVLMMSDLTNYFVNPAMFDLHLLATAPAVNAGSSDLAPTLDRDGIARPQGSAMDRGAYEWHDPSVMPADGGGMPGTDSGGMPGTDGAVSRPDAGGPTTLDGGSDVTSAVDGGVAGDAARVTTPRGCACRAGHTGPMEGDSRSLLLLACVILVGKRQRSRKTVENGIA